jgi:hypothetical protein
LRSPCSVWCTVAKASNRNTRRALKALENIFPKVHESQRVLVDGGTTTRLRMRDQFAEVFVILQPSLDLVGSLGFKCNSNLIFLDPGVHGTCT